MVKADGHVRIRHESNENGQVRVRHESKEKGISYIEVDDRDRQNLIAPLIENLSCILDNGDISPSSDNSCSCQTTPESGSIGSGDNCNGSRTSSSRNSKISDCDNCTKSLLNRGSSSPSHSLGGACNVAEDVETCDTTTGDDPTRPLCSCDNCNDNISGDFDSKNCNHGNRADPWFKKGFQYDFAIQAAGKTKTGHLAPLSVSDIQCQDNGDYKIGIQILECDTERDGDEIEPKTSRKQCCYNVFVLLLLLFANLLNYMDRYTIAGVLPEIKKYYGGESGTELSDSDAGLLQTSFIIFYMLFSPLFGYLGDRYNRTILMSVGIVAWSVVTLAGSFIPNNMFWVFVFMRGLVGIGEASYSTIAPTIIADLFQKDKRTKALACFYFAIPVGSGLGYIVGSLIAKAAGEWQWALRFTPGLGLLCAILIFFFVKEPPRGESDAAGGVQMSHTSYLDDLVYLFKNKSFMLSTAGFTCVAFLAGALAFWAPTFMEYGIKAMFPDQDPGSVGLTFGVITCVAGLVGVIVGSETARRLRHRFKTADPLVCAFGLISCSPFFFLSVFLAKYNTTATWVLIFVGETLLCLNWSIVTDILLYVVIPTRRSTAEAFQILVSHALGDAGSPYLVGLISDGIKGSDKSLYGNFISLQYALFSMSFVAVIGGAFFMGTAHFIVRDKEKADKFIRGEASEDSSDQEESGLDENKPVDKEGELAVLA